MPSNLSRQNKPREAERFINSLYPKLYLPLWCNDGENAVSHDSYGHIFGKYKEGNPSSNPIWTPQGMLFDGIDDYYTTEVAGVLGRLRVSGLLTGLSQATVIAWLKVNAYYGTDQYPFRVTNNTSLFRFGLYIQDAIKTLRTFIRSDAETSVTKSGITGAVTAGVFHFCAGRVNLLANVGDTTVDNISNSTTYGTLNGTLANTSFQAITPGVNAYTILSTSVTNFFKGVIGEVAIFPKWLTNQELSRIYELTKWRYQ